MKQIRPQILIADPNPAWIQTVGQWLEPLGYRFCAAGNGCEVLTLILRHTFDAVLIDLDLPAISGLDVVRSIRRSEPGVSRRLLLIGMAEPGVEPDRVTLIESGLDAMLHKPFAEAELRLALQALAVEPATVQSGSLAAGPTRPVGELAPPCPTTPTPALAPCTECVDGEKIAEFLGSDPDLYADMVALLMQEFPRRMGQIGTAIDQRDGKTLERGAHSLKGAMSYFCAKPIIQKLQRLENAGRELDFAAAQPQHRELEIFFPRLKQALLSRLSSSHEAVQVPVTG